MIYHVVPLAEWAAAPDRPYAPASLEEEGFVHCSPDTEVTLAVVNAFYRDAPRPLLALLLDEERLTAQCVWEEAAPVPPPGVAAGALFPHVLGPVNRDAVVRIQEVQWGADGRAVALRDAG
ncbi:DUF952 domain-containing protein [Streptomyces mangrovisoli]|uniref:DUF952 domain-containing protein n=1 Tax=Streptomyces mangrovisoli TaxID=1428628 RepID=A0A1J4NNA0_9ACTN|nr:DUF952 domain-containing protein [Streptomyces mangrovisoli]OIJ62757.1 hypothetical protein WN71_037750 [Streptomyces mangrovisoli]